MTAPPSDDTLAGWRRWVDDGHDLAMYPNRAEALTEANTRALVSLQHVEHRRPMVSAWGEFMTDGAGKTRRLWELRHGYGGECPMMPRGAS